MKIRLTTFVPAARKAAPRSCVAVGLLYIPPKVQVCGSNLPKSVPDYLKNIGFWRLKPCGYFVSKSGSPFIDQTHASDYLSVSKRMVAVKNFETSNY
jgi:hypothetical protein